MKKLFSLLFAICLATDIFASVYRDGFDAIGTVTLANGIGYYLFDDGTASVKSASTTCAGTITIPASFTASYNDKSGVSQSGTFTVMAISERAFLERPNITKVVYPKNLTFIGTGAFAYCTNLKSVVPSSYAYLSTTCYITDKITQLGANIIDGTAITNLMANFNIALCKDDNVAGAYEGSEAFSYADKLTTVVLRGGAPKYCFQDNSSIQTVTFTSGGNSQVVCKEAFNSCSALTTVKFYDGTPVVRICEDAFQSCHALQKVTMPSSGLTTICEGAFSLCPKLTDFDLGGVTTIWQNAFQSCGLKTITLTPSVSDLTEGAFNDCWSLTSLIINTDNLSGVGLVQKVFSNCPNLTSITFGENATTVQRGLCKNMSQLTTLDVSKCETIWEEAFMGTSLETVDITADVIGKDAFSMIPTLKSATLHKLHENVEPCFRYSGADAAGSQAIINLAQASDRYDYTSSTRSPFYGSCFQKGVITLADGVLPPDHIFDNCANMKEISFTTCPSGIGDIAEDCPRLEAYTCEGENGDLTFTDGLIYDSDGTSLYVAPENITKAIKVPSTVKYILEPALHAGLIYDCTGVSTADEAPILSDVTSDNVPTLLVTQKGADAFAECYSGASYTGRLAVIQGKWFIAAGKHADVNGDESVDIADVNAVLKTMSE